MYIDAGASTTRQSYNGQIHVNTYILILVHHYVVTHTRDNLEVIGLCRVGCCVELAIDYYVNYMIVQTVCIIDITDRFDL